MTDDQYDNWEDKIPDFLSTKTFKIAAALKIRAEEEGVDLGTPMKSRRNGDSMWFLVTDGVRYNVQLPKGVREVQHLTVILCTPHCILIEDNYKGVDVEYAVLSDVDLYIEHLSNMNMRALNDEEFKRFLEGNL